MGDFAILTPHGQLSRLLAENSEPVFTTNPEIDLSIDGAARWRTKPLFDLTGRCPCPEDRFGGGIDEALHSDAV
jgi:hypothetical protein